MKKLVLFSALLSFSSNTFASAKVCKKGDVLEVHSNIIFYGSKAAGSGPACAKEIRKMYNRPDAKVAIKGKKYKVKFKVCYQVETDQAAYSSTHINTRVENNYVRIEEKANNEKNGRSNHNIAANIGFYATADALGASTTCAHEFGHGLGLLHYDDRKTPEAYGGKKELIGKGRPGIMAERGFKVDPEFQYNPSADAGDGKNGGTVNPYTREVRKEDIADLNLDKLNFDRAGCADLGHVSGIAYTASGETTKGKKNYFADAVDYLERKRKGSLSTSICSE